MNPRTSLYLLPARSVEFRERGTVQAVITLTPVGVRLWYTSAVKSALFPARYEPTVDSY